MSSLAAFKSQATGFVSVRFWLTGPGYDFEGGVCSHDAVFGAGWGDDWVFSVKNPVGPIEQCLHEAHRIGAVFPVEFEICEGKARGRARVVGYSGRCGILGLSDFQVFRLEGSGLVEVES